MEVEQPIPPMEQEGGGGGGGGGGRGKGRGREGEPAVVKQEESTTPGGGQEHLLLADSEPGEFHIFMESHMFIDFLFVCLSVF